MAVKGDKREGYKLYTGLCDMKVVAINPTREKLAELYKKEDVKLTDYTSMTKDGNARLRVDIYLQNDDLKIFTKATLWLEDKLMQSKDGNMKQYINTVGLTCWIKDGDNAPNWFKGDYRQAYLGEEALYKFLSSWTAIDPKKPGSQIMLDTEFSDIIQGDTSELESLVDPEVFGSDKVRVLLSVKEGKYQDVFTKVFLTAGSNYVKKLRDVLEDDASRGYAYKSDYQDSFDLKEFTGSTTGSSESHVEEEESPEEMLARLQNQEAN